VDGAYSVPAYPMHHASIAVQAALAWLYATAAVINASRAPVRVWLNSERPWMAAAMVSRPRWAWYGSTS
jgi:hypothetical protein